MLQHLEMNSISQGRKAMKNLHRDGDVHIKVEKEIHGASWAKVGSTIPGRLYDIRNKLVPFDGKQPHMVMPFQGSRISIVYFTLRHCAREEEEEEEEEEQHQILSLVLLLTRELQKADRLVRDNPSFIDPSPDRQNSIQFCHRRVLSSRLHDKLPGSLQSGQLYMEEESFARSLSSL